MMTTSQKNQTINFKHLRPDGTFLLAPKMMGSGSPQHFSRTGNLVGRQTPIPNYQFNKDPTFYLAPEMLGRCHRWGKPTISQFMWQLPIQPVDV